MSYTLEISELSKCYDAFKEAMATREVLRMTCVFTCLTKVVLTQPASDKSVYSDGLGV